MISAILPILRSVMMYGYNYFSINGQPTITLKDSSIYEHQRISLTTTDALQVTIYKSYFWIKGEMIEAFFTSEPRILIFTRQTLKNRKKKSNCNIFYHIKINILRFNGAIAAIAKGFSTKRRWPVLRRIFSDLIEKSSPTECATTLRIALMEKMKAKLWAVKILR